MRHDIETRTTTYEESLRCRYFPDCMIHTGSPLTRRFTPETVREIAELYRDDEWRVNELAEYYGVTNGAIIAILDGETYRDVDRWVRTTRFREQRGREVRRWSKELHNLDQLREARRERRNSAQR